MTGLWTYPWSLLGNSADSTLAMLAESGVDRLKIAGHYHSVRTLDPQADTTGFTIFPGGCLFDPDTRYFQNTPISPSQPEGYAMTDSFETAVDVATRHGFAVDAWVVCLHGSRMADKWPAYQIQDVFGDTHSHAFCPSHPEVQNYLAGIVGNISELGVDRIDLESLGFPSVFHDHGSDFGHHKDHAITSRAEEFLVSQCFCKGCQHAAAGTFDILAAKDLVETLTQRALESPAQEVLQLTDLIEQYPLLDDLFTFRETVIESLLATLTDTLEETRLNYYIADGGRYTPADLWPSGVTPTLLETYLDDVTVLCYTGDSETVDHRISAARESLTHDLDAGVTLDPAIVDGRDHWHRLSKQVEDAISGDRYVYNYGLMTDAHVEWVRSFSSSSGLER